MKRSEEAGASGERCRRRALLRLPAAGAVTEALGATMLKFSGIQKQLLK